MAESPRKRLREGENEGETLEGEAETKRQCSFHHIISILESEEDEPTQDLSSLVTTLQQELASLPDPVSEPPPSQLNPTQPDPPSSSFSALAPPSELLKEDDEEEEVIRHLLEASDDDLGIPQAENDGGVAERGEWSEVSTYDQIWELEDVAANYYTWLQSELFM